MTHEVYLSSLSYYLALSAIVIFDCIRVDRAGPFRGEMDCSPWR